MTEKQTKKNLQSEIFDWIKTIATALIISLVVTKFGFAHTIVPSGSMIPTIHVKDHLIINKIPMYYRDPHRGEIVVFHGEDMELIKRVIALPGDTIDIRNGKVYINDEVLEEAYLAEGTITKPTVPGSLFHYTYPYTIPENQYFMMGDNRGNSKDSRAIGTINREAIYATANLRIWPINSIGDINTR